jgi:hypothetical protein
VAEFCGRLPASLPGERAYLTVGVGYFLSDFLAKAALQELLVLPLLAWPCAPPSRVDRN